ncbi:MAG: hypothetical protein ABIB93_00730 [Chloroflexota bacterium]
MRHEGGMHHQGGRPGMRGNFGPFGHRRFISREEVIARLEEYLKNLRAEATAVEERITELKQGGTAANSTTLEP